MKLVLKDDKPIVYRPYRLIILWARTCSRYGRRNEKCRYVSSRRVTRNTPVQYCLSKRRPVTWECVLTTMHSTRKQFLTNTHCRGLMTRSTDSSVTNISRVWICLADIIRYLLMTTKRELDYLSWPLMVNTRLNAYHLDLLIVLPFFPVW